MSVLRDGVQSDGSARFEILSALGSGSYGAVYEARDLRTGQHVAVKQLDSASAENIARFKHEFRALADCHHPNLVSLKELIEQDGRWLIVMELVPGQDLLTYVRRRADNHNSPGFDEARLRGALSGIAEGLKALHGFGVLHRDLKPSNVRVRPDGRAVLLDFGLATSIDIQNQSLHAMTVGTIRYMAPEQASAQHVGPPADLYALGVCLFEALTGRAPFEHEQPLKILLEKQEREAPRASSFAPGIPPDLDALCTALLRIEARARPSPQQVIEALSASAPGQAALGRGAPVAPAHDTFTGRESELEHLERALMRTHQGALRIIFVEGESGVGKSELVAEFLRRARVQHPRLVALRGRCYENEQVSYKAFDGCVDELSRVLKRMPDSESAALLPVRAALLGQLFPVLRDIAAIAKAPRVGVSADPTARRLEAFGALAALLSSLAEDRPVVLVVDDLQWADAESFRLLQALVEHTPQPPILLLATIRPRDELEPDVLAQVEAVRRWKQTDVVQLFGLPRAQAVALASRLLGDSAPESWLNMIAEESHGHPLFLSELVHYTQSHDAGARERLTLEDALRARIERLEQPTRALFELVALAARPHGTHVFARALGVPEVDEAARELLAIKLLKLRKGQELGVYHDRIRRAAVELIVRTRLPGLHARLASALAHTAADPAEQARHWDLANDHARAVDAYELAIARAFETLAFTRAEQLCARALELLGKNDTARAQKIEVLRADALACAGQSGAAAALYQRVADRASGDTRVRLRTRAAQHLILSTRIEEGLLAARKLLGDVGLSLPLGTRGSLARYAWDRLCLLLRIDRFRVRRRTPDGERKLALQREVLDGLQGTISIAHPLALRTLAAQELRLMQRRSHGKKALQDGTRAALALVRRGWLIAAGGSLPSALPLFEKSRQLLSDAHVVLVATQRWVEGSARLAGGDYAGGAACLEHAHRVYQEQSRDRPWALTPVRYNLSAAWHAMGEHARLAREVDTWMAEARERNDLLAIALISGMGYGFLRHLMRDEPDRALREIEEALRPLPAQPFGFAQFGSMIGSVLSLVYRGGSDALRWLDAFEPAHAGAFLLKTRFGKDGRLILRSLALMAAIASAPRFEDADREQVAALRKLTRALVRRSSTLSQGYGYLLAAQLAALSGDRDDALANARAAHAQFLSAKHWLSHHAIYLEGLLEGGVRGRAKQATCIEAYRAQGWLDPLRGIAISLPALPLLRAPTAEAPSDRLLGRYEISTRLGAGGFGTVTQARDVETGRVLALKELARGGGTSLERFKQEFRALQELHHPNLAQLESLFEHDGRWYIAMELVDGTDLLTYTRSEGACSPARLQTAFFGVASGLAALHAEGFVHRDVSPANVRVTADGRAVLLDFGLIARRRDVRDDQPIGNVEYAAPEQLAGAAADESADVYALGTCLYQALFGKLPFQAPTLAQLLACKRGPPPSAPPPPGLEDVTACCMRMLSPTPEERPPLEDVLALFATARQRHPRRRSLSPLARTGVDETRELGFSGRDAELALIGKAFEKSGDRMTIALVEGESGVGKSVLANEFARRVQADWVTLQVLKTRCYENEQLAFKAFDGAVDQLAQVLRALPNPECEALLPRKAALLAQLFPVLTSVPAIAQASKKGLPADPAAQKLAARTCFIQLLASVATRLELLFVIDDLQWADEESFRLLQALLGHAEQLPIFFLCTVRGTGDLDPMAAREIDALRNLPNTTVIPLDGLLEDDAISLASHLHGAALAPDRLRALVRESKGHPLFLRTLIGHALSGSPESSASNLTLDEALRAHVSRLGDKERTLLTLAALAGRPLGVHVFVRAMPTTDLRETIITLRAQELLRKRGNDQVACYHDRIRKVALASILPARRQKLARALAAALDSEASVEPAERARLWDEGRAYERAVVAYEEAGDRALEGLAFAAAEQHYARALALLSELGKPHDELRQVREKLLVQRGDALARAGRSADAARTYQAAAEEASGETQVRLRIQAARHLIQGAHVAEGMRAAQAILGELGLTVPRTERAALARIAWARSRSFLRGTSLRTPTRPMSQHERLVLEALYRLSTPVLAVSYLPGSTLLTEYLRRALAAGDPTHAARALAYEAHWRTLRAPHRDQSVLFDRSRVLAETTGAPALIAEVELVRGLASLTRGEFSTAPAHIAAAHELLQARCPGESFLLTTTRMYLCSSWLYTGDTPALMRHAETWIEEARARDDRYALAALAGFGAAAARHLVVDRPDRALAELRAVMTPWPDEPFSTIHFGELVMTGTALNYGPPTRALLDWLDTRSERFARAFLLRASSGSLALQTFRLIGLENAMPSRNAPETRDLVARARAELAVLTRNRSRGARGISALHRGILDFVDGDSDAALRHFRQAQADLARVGHLYAPGAEYWIGLLEGGESGRQRCETILDGLRKQGWVNVRHALRLVAPGVHLAD